MRRRGISIWTPVKPLDIPISKFLGILRGEPNWEALLKGKKAKIFLQKTSQRRADAATGDTHSLLWDDLGTLAAFQHVKFGRSTLLSQGRFA